MQKGFVPIYSDKLFKTFLNIGVTTYKYYNIGILPARPCHIEKCAEAKRVISNILNEIYKMCTLQSISCFWQSIIGSDIPVFDDTINKTYSVKLLAMDIKRSSRMSVFVKSIKMADNLHLLFNYFNLNEHKELKFRAYYTPINVSIRIIINLLIKDEDVPRELINPVKQVSRKDWKSISKKNLPVANLNPGMVTLIYPCFDDPKLSEFGRNDLWFL